jgi:hypothetical protein
MKKPLNTVMLLAAAILFSIGASPVFAQSAPKCEIKKITPEFVSPGINAGYSKKTPPGHAPQWLEVDVEFNFPQPDKSGAKFTDDLTVNYYILLNNASLTEDKKSTVLTGAVSHTDIQYGKGLHVGAFVSPQTLARFFEGRVPATAPQTVIDIGVTLSDASGTLAKEGFKSQVRGDKGWWDNAEKFTEVSGRVLSKDATPFAHLAWDYYLPLKAK